MRTLFYWTFRFFFLSFLSPPYSNSIRSNIVPSRSCCVCFGLVAGTANLKCTIVQICIYTIRYVCCTHQHNLDVVILRNIVNLDQKSIHRIFYFTITIVWVVCIRCKEYGGVWLLLFLFSFSYFSNNIQLKIMFYCSYVD